VSEVVRRLPSTFPALPEDVNEASAAADFERTRAERGGPKITPAQRMQIALANRATLKEELLDKRFAFSSRPYEAYLQFSNFCNMSCIMCHAGANPPMKKMSPALLEKIATQLAPNLSVVTPHDGSEPLIVSWDETRRISHDYSVRLDLTTNAQYLDEAKFYEAKDIVDQIVLSIDSHIPEQYEKIRPGSKPRKVFANLHSTAHLAAKHGIDCIAQIVFMTENAALLPETVAYMADAGIPSINILQMLNANGRSGYLDPLSHFSAEWIAWIKEKCVSVAREKKVVLGWNVGAFDRFDFREPEKVVPALPSRKAADEFDFLMRRQVPGYCRFVYKSIRVTAGGDVAPCGNDIRGDLHLGNLEQQDFDEIWNSPTAQDLRRAHTTWDYPVPCNTCYMTGLLPPQAKLPFIDHFLASKGAFENREASLEADEPKHMARQIEPPVFRIQKVDHGPGRYFVAFGLAGENDHIEASELEPVERGSQLEFRIDEAVWTELPTNLGYWWALFRLSDDPALPHVYSKEVRCIIRHEDVGRIENSNLSYPEQSHLVSLNLGGGRQVGWTGHAEPRPELEKGDVKAARESRLAKGVAHTARVSSPSGTTPDRYREEIRQAVRSALPEDAIVRVVTNGDQELLYLDDRETRPFPARSDGGYAGPIDDAWAVEHLEDVRESGAQYLLVPSTALSWFDSYPRLAGHLESTYPVLLEDHTRCVIFDLREPMNGSPPTHSIDSELTMLATAPEGSESEAIPEATGPENADRELSRRADELLAYGNQHRMLMRPLYGGEQDTFPYFAERAEGYELFDSSGRSYVDWVNGGGPVLLGYRHPAVEEAIVSQLAAGPMLTLMNSVEVEVASMLTEMIPCAEMVTFGKNGSDVVTAAVRVARAATGRQVILQFGIHGFHDWFTCLHRGAEGIPKILRSLVYPFPYNDLAALERLFDEYIGEVAAVVMEPMTVDPPVPGYLEGVRELTQRYGALLVFDEMVTAFRLGNGGAQELFGVTPDLSCGGKAIANGMPLSVLVGKREYMEYLPKVAYGMTFRGETLSLAAARAVLRTLCDEPVAEQVARTGAQLRAGYSAACAELGIHSALIGPDARMAFSFSADAAISSTEIQTAFLKECARNGVLTNGNILPSYAHDAEAIDRSIKGFQEALKSVGSVIQAGRKAVRKAFREGFVDDQARASIAAGARPPGGYLDGALEEGGNLSVWGWFLFEDGPADVVELVPKSGEVRAAAPMPRADLAQVFQSIPNAGASGFTATIPAYLFAPEGDYVFTLRARRGDRVMFECSVVRTHSEHHSGTLHPPRWSREERTLYI
jgi:glutamate-1-semialdehyde 2,1-aminomutase